MFAPVHQFSAALNKTPQSTDQVRVIPWDHTQMDFVYGAIHPKLFGGLISRDYIKQVVDKHLSLINRVFAVAYPIYMIVAAVIIVLSIIYFFLAILVFWPKRRKYFLDQEYWWIVFGPLPVYILFIIGTICFMRARDDSKTKNRIDELDKACDEINKGNLAGTGYRFETGNYGAWIEIHIDKAIGKRSIISS